MYFAVIQDPLWINEKATLLPGVHYWGAYQVKSETPLVATRILGWSKKHEVILRMSSLKFPHLTGKYVNRGIGLPRWIPCVWDESPL